MLQPPFPESVGFAWAYYLVLVGLLLAAAYSDMRRMVVPKTLTLPILALGLLFNCVRGAWLGAREPVWPLGQSSPWFGAVDGLLFALAGLAVGFGLFFVMWILGTCGGGDVKLFAALGAYVGWRLTVALLAATLVLVVVYTCCRFVFGFLTRGSQGPAGGGAAAAPSGKEPRRKKLAYAPALVVSTALVLLWTLREPLGLTRA